MTVAVLKCCSNQEVVDKLRSVFEELQGLLPGNPNASIVVKPNLNSNLDALTGNTTDLRVLVAMLRVLTERGFRRITILEGPNGGYHRDGIDVFARNRIDCMAAYYGCEVKDANYERDTFSIEFDKSGTAQIASLFKACDFLINVPKLKTHYEALTSVSLKSLVGVLVGQANKAKAHASLFENILRLNDIIVPHLNIVDGLIAMEGTGPSAGVPVRTDTILVGTNSYAVDIAAGRLMGFLPEELPLIRHALVTGRITQTFLAEASQDVRPLLARSFYRPSPGLLARLVVAPCLGPVVRTVRNSQPVARLLKNEWARRLLLRLGVTQEVILHQERDVHLLWKQEACASCGKCRAYCPQMLNLPRVLETTPSACIGCLYCFAVCPKSAIEAQGELGYYQEQIRRYGKRIKAIA